MSIIRGLLASVIYWGLAAGTFYLFWWLNPLLLYFYLTALALLIARHALGIRNWVTKLGDTNDAEWRYIEFAASWLLEVGKPHCIPSIGE